MDICMLYSSDDSPIPKRRNFLTGRLSYIADGSSLLGARFSSSDATDIIVVSAERADAAVTPAIYDEARRQGCKKVFLDAESPSPDAFSEICSSLLRRGITVFCPDFIQTVPGVIPVIDASVSGGFLSEVFEKARRRNPDFAVSISPSFCETPLPAGKATFCALPRREVFSIIKRFDPDIYFSPQMQCKYFLYNPETDNVRLVLFDDGETLSSKIRLAKKHGASHAFFIHTEVSDFINEMVF